jgi:hypothetical protein
VDRSGVGDGDGTARGVVAEPLRDDRASRRETKTDATERTRATGAPVRARRTMPRW